MMASARNSLEKVDLEEQHQLFDDKEISPAPRKTTFSWKKTLTILLLVIQSLLILKLWWMNQNCSILKPEHGDTIERKWIRNTSYMSLNHAYDGLWNETGQSALVYDDHKNVVQITMFHQLHCLASIRKALQEASEGKEIGMDEKDNTHWPHCLQFLREAIVCTADGTLEHHPPDPVHGLIISGYGDMRACGSAAKLYEYRDERKIYYYNGSLVSNTPWDEE